ncbi:MAG TPA: MFS transporter [Candidatus Campbellbacteria bacterium]|nr:MFS transporter [Candidatus Campbellbacteria bacterium]
MNLSIQKKYFDGEISHGFVSLYTGKTIVMIATGLLGMFLPIFLYNLFGQNIQSTFIYYVLGYFFYGLFAAFGAKFLNRFGFRRALRLSVFLGALFYTIFYFIDKNNLIYLIPFSIVVLVLYRLLYWIPYHVDFAKFTDKKNRGRQLSAIMATRRVISVFIPLSAGFLVSRFGFDMLFVIAIALYLVSGIPYITIPRTHEKFSWTYLETLKKIFSKKNRRMIMAYMAYGSEEVVGFIIWPIFIFQILDGNYFKVGALSSLIIGATVVFQLVLGKYIDGGRRSKILQMGSILYSLGWIAKIFIATAFQIFIIGSYHNFTRIFLRTPFNALTYEIAADEGHYVDEFTVVKEMAVNLGKTIMAILAIIISLFFALKWTFILAAAAVLLFNLLSVKEGLLFPKTAD